MVPGLYIEKGWVHESIDYSFTPPPEDKPAEPEVEEEEDGGSAATNDSQGQWLIFIKMSLLKNEYKLKSQLFHMRWLITVYLVGAEKDDGSIDGAISEGAQQGGAAADICIETTVPKQGQNLW